MKARQIFNLLLADAEKNSTAGKTLFGQYSNKQLKAWDDVLTAYNNGNVYLVEAARLMTQATNYDVPELKTTLANARKVATEATKKRVDLEKALKDEQNGLIAACHKLGIAGPDCKSSIKQLRFKLPALLYDIQIAVRHPVILAAVEYYTAFTAFVRSQCGAAPVKILPTITSIVSVPLAPLKQVETKSQGDAITSNDATPSFSPPGDGGEEGWDVVCEMTDWEITVEGGESESKTVEADVVTDALASLPIAQLTDDIMELQAFLTVRVSDSKEQGVGMLDQLPSVPDVVRTNDSAKVAAQLAKVKEVVALLTSPQLHQFISIHNSDKHVELMALEFQQREKRVDKVRGRLLDLEDRTQEAQRSVAKTQPILLQRVKELAALKGMVESAVSGMCDGRPVHIIGAINTL